MSKRKKNDPDELEIPLLDDVVDPEEIQFTASSTEYQEPQLSEHQAIIEVLREGIAEQLLKELQPIVKSAVETVVSQATLQVEQLLLDELNSSLENRMHTLISESLDTYFRDGPKNV